MLEVLEAAELELVLVTMPLALEVLEVLEVLVVDAAAEELEELLDVVVEVEVAEAE
jgi:hypothetical protein